MTEYHQSIIVGKHTYGMKNIDVKWWDGTKYIYIGAFSSIGENVTMYLGNGMSHHTHYFSTFPFGILCTDIFSAPMDCSIISNGHIHIGNDVWICDNVTVVSGVKIGDGAIIACNSHVIKDVEPYGIYGGNPATLIKYRFEDCTVQRLLKMEWWNWDDKTINENLALLYNENFKSII